VTTSTEQTTTSKPPAPFTVVASVGTYHHPFDRFVEWLEPWTTQNHAAVVFQHGSTRPMQNSDNHEMLAPNELLEHYMSADAIVLQGGAGGVMDARKAGRIPIVVPRVPVDHEVVDDHQVVLCRRLADLGIVHVAESAEELARLLDGVREGTVPTRLDSGLQSPGVAETIRLMALNLPTHETDDAQREMVMVRRAVRHPGMLGTLTNVLFRRGLLGHVLAVAIPLLVLVALDVSPIYIGATIGLIALWLLCAATLVPRINRARSFRPALSLAVATTVAAGLKLFGVVTDSRDFQFSLTAALVAAATLAVATLVNRLAFRRVPVVLIGEDVAVRRLATQWGVRDDVDVVASCAWRDGIEPERANSGLVRLLPEVMKVVTRYKVRSVVVVADEPMATATKERLSPIVRLVGTTCVLSADMDHDLSPVVVSRR
jgi:UDP-N-acetylglucosamine transferase subunit ALG13